MMLSVDRSYHCRSEILSRKVCLSAEAKKKGLANQTNPLKVCIFRVPKL